jgi:dTDP-4-dehydrorhamnose reductase
MRVLILGGDSVIGAALEKYWRCDEHISCYSSTRHKNQVSNCRPYINLERPELFKLERHYDVAILCASESNISKCEFNKEKTRGINVINTYAISKKMSQRNTHVIFLSSNQVFDGTKPFRETRHKTNAISEYGMQKSDAERLISGLKSYSILRLTKVIHNNLPLLSRWHDDLKNGKTIYAFKDMTLSPVDISDVVLKIDYLARNRKKGIFHCSGDADISYYNFAVKYANQLGYSSDKVEASYCKTKGILPPNFTSLKG